MVGRETEGTGLSGRRGEGEREGQGEYFTGNSAVACLPAQSLYPAPISSPCLECSNRYFTLHWTQAEALAGISFTCGQGGSGLQRHCASGRLRTAVHKVNCCTILCSAQSMAGCIIIVKPTGQALKKPHDGRKFGVNLFKPGHAWTFGLNKNLFETKWRYKKSLCAHQQAIAYRRWAHTVGKKHTIYGGRTISLRYQ